MTLFVSANYHIKALYRPFCLRTLGSVPQRHVEREQLLELREEGLVCEKCWKRWNRRVKRIERVEAAKA